MRNGLLIDRRLILAAALLATTALASIGAPSARGDVAQVTVVSPGGAAQTLALDALAGSADVLDRGYALRSGAGETTETVSGFSLAALLAAAGADPYGFSYLEVQRPQGGAVLLSREQALDAGAFPDGPPVVYATAAGTGFLRPSAGPGDLNVADSFAAPQGISIVLRKGSRLRVRAEASTLRTRPGNPVDFSVEVDGAAAGERLAYSWYFDDGAAASGPEATHGFAKRGSYDVVVGVTSGGDDTGASAVVTVQVGAPLAGPDRKGGGRDNDAAPDHGTAGPAGGRGARAPSDTQPAAASSVRGGTTPSPAAEPARGSVADGERVVGELVSSRAPTGASGSRPAAARRGQLEKGDGSGGIPGAAWGLLAALGLLGTGALTEAGGLARLRLRGGGA